MSPRRISKARRARLVGALLFFGATSVASGFYLVNPLSYWPVSAISGDVVFQVGLVANPPNVPNPPLSDGSVSWDAAFVSQLNAWNAVLPDGVLNFSAVVGSLVTPGEGDGVNNVFFSPTVYGDTWGTSTAGVCLSFWTGNRRTEADVLFNSTKTWNAYTGNLQGNTTDFRRVALHELGHALLLDHPDDVGQSVNAIMNSVSSNTDALTADDIAGVSSLYGALTPITITAQPRQPTTTSGGNASFSVGATGSEPLTYQWQRSTNGGGTWSNIGGFTFASGSFGPFNPGDDGNLFRVSVTNPVGSVTSAAVMLIVSGANAPDFSLAPVNATIDEGEDVIFAAHAGGTPTPTYQWQYSSDSGGVWQSMFSSFGETDASGINSPTLKITRANASMHGFQFRAVATNGSGTQNSPGATLTVNAGGAAPHFPWQPLDLYAQVGGAAMFVTGAAGAPAPALQWQRSTDGGTGWANLSNDATFGGATTSTLTVTGATVGQSGHLFRLNATNASGAVVSRAAQLSVGSAAGAPTVIDDPDNVSVAEGAAATFAARVTSLPAPVFQWELSGDGVVYSPFGDGLIVQGTIVLDTIATGANTRTLRLANVNGALADYRFRLVVRNAAGTATSAAAMLTIGVGSTAPAFTAQPGDSTRVAGENAAFAASATGSPAPTLQWQRSTNGGVAWSNLINDATFAGVTSGTLSVTTVTVSMNGHLFRAVATNGVLPDANSDDATLTVNKAPATVTLSNLSRPHTGAPLSPSASTTPGGLAVVFTFNGSSTVPTAVGSYELGATVDDPDYQGTASGTFTIVPALALGQAGPVNTPAGGVTALSVTATGGTTPAYQWQMQAPGGGAWSDVAGATGATWSLPSTQRFHAGNYRVVVTANGVAATSPAVILTVVAPAPSASRLLNLSTRGLSASGDDVLIPGFVLEGTGTKRVLIRAVGPTLGVPPFGLAGVVPDPRMELKRFNTGTNAFEDVGANDDWGTNANAAEIVTVSDGLFAFRLTQPKDAALLMNLAPGRYSVIARDTTNTSGLAIVEVYDADTASPTSRLINISNRGYSGVGDEVMIPGFVVSAEGPKTLLARVVGPTLGGAPFNVAGTMANPRLVVFDSVNGVSTEILSQDNWQDNPDAAHTATVAEQVFAFPLNPGSLDAAFVITLAPGSYTILGTSSNGSGEGVVLVEVYVVP